MNECTEIDYIECYKYLGVWLDGKLSYEIHINELLKRVKACIGFLYRNKSSFTHSLKQHLVKLTVLPILHYGDLTYRSASRTLLHNLDVIHHAAVGFVTGAPFNTHHCLLTSLVNWHHLQNSYWGNATIFTVSS